MRLSLLLRSWAALLSLSLAVACSSSDEQQPITSTPAQYCASSCAKAHACNDAIDVVECGSSCQGELGAAPELRADLLGYVSGCVESSACSSSTTVKCKNEAQAQLAISSYGKSFCSAFVAAGMQCDATGANYPETDCLGAAKSYQDSALKAANDCLGKPCAELSACLARAIPEVTLPR